MEEHIINPMGELLEKITARYPYKTAIVYKNIEITYAQLNKTVNKLANALIKLGLNKGVAPEFQFPRYFVF